MRPADPICSCDAPDALRKRPALQLLFQVQGAVVLCSVCEVAHHSVPPVWHFLPCFYWQLLWVHTHYTSTGIHHVVIEYQKA
jgi:hypothetical protein